MAAGKRNSSKKSPTKATSLRLSSELAAELKAVARAQGVTISELVRAALSDHIASVRSDERFQPFHEFAVLLHLLSQIRLVE